MKSLPALAASVLLLLFGLWPAQPAVAACNTYYVANTGDDRNPGSIERPWRTLAKAAATAVVCETVLVRGGTYFEAVRLSRSGAPSAPIKFSAFPGEVPIVDGGYAMPDEWGALIHLAGSYLEVSGFEVRNSAFHGVHLEGHHNAARKLRVHHALATGILARGDDAVVEQCRIWRASLGNRKGAEAAKGTWWNAGLAVGRDPLDGITRRAVLTGNVVRNNWGDGIATFESDGSVIQDNVIADNWGTSIFLADASNALVQRNRLSVRVKSSLGPGRCGLCVADSSGFHDSTKVSIINNLVYGASTNFAWFSGHTDSRMDNIVVANNTFVSPEGAVAENVVIDHGVHAESRFINNIVYRKGAGLPVRVVEGASGVEFSHNLWSALPQPEAAAPDDVIGDPRLSMASPGARWWKLKRNSPAMRHAATLDRVREDYFRRPRATTPDIGAHQRSR